MARPQPTVLLEKTDRRSYKSEQVLESEAIWAVFYKGKPINLKSSSLLAGYAAPKYKKVSFSNSGHALNLAEKLNVIHNCTDFAVYILTHGERYRK